MNKLMAFFTFSFVLMTMLSSLMEGQSGFAATPLTQTIDEDDTVITVSDTSRFLSSDIIWIGDEQIYYTSKTATTFITSAEYRGYNGTEARVHTAPTRVYNRSANIINQVVGFNIAESVSTIGAFRVALTMPGALTKALVKFVTWDYSFLEGDLSMIKFVVLYPLSAGLIFSIFFAAIGLARSLFLP